MGARDGPAVEYNWVAAAPTVSGFRSEADDGSAAENDWFPSGVLPWVPWLVIFGLLALKQNRRPAAWLIWLPLGCVMALTLLPPMMSGEDHFFLDVIAALAFGLAAVWLLSNYLRRPHRWLTFLFVLITLAGFSALTVVSRQGWDLLEAGTQPTGIVLGVGVLASAISLSFGGLTCRKCFRPAGLYLWLLLSLAFIWLMIAAPFFIIAEISNGDRIPLSEFFTPVLAVAAGNFALLLPFLILSSANSFYRERLKALLPVQPEAPPPLSATTMKPI